MIINTLAERRLNMENEIEKINWFINFLKRNCNFVDDNFLIEKRINDKIIDLIIVNRLTNNIKPLAIIEFKKPGSDFNSAQKQVENYLNLLKENNLPSFLIHGNELFILLSYGWQRLEFNDFPKLEKLI